MASTWRPPIREVQSPWHCRHAGHSFGVVVHGRCCSNQTAHGTVTPAVAEECSRISVSPPGCTLADVGVDTLGPVGTRRDRAAGRYGVPAVLLAAAAVGWWWSARMAGEMRSDDVVVMNMTAGSAMTAAGFFVAWLAMMSAMMFPAVTPVVQLYARAAGRGRVAPLPYFVGGYLGVWALLGVPAYFVWRALDMPIAEGADWVGRLAGVCFVAAGVWQLTPFKELCLRHCRSPMSFFMRYGRSIRQPMGAARMGASHGMYCVGCCWAMFAVLVAVGTMNLRWMLLLTALIVVEKTFRHGPRVAFVAGAVFVGIGTMLLISPASVAAIT